MVKTIGISSTNGGFSTSVSMVLLFFPRKLAVKFTISAGESHQIPWKSHVFFLSQKIPFKYWLVVWNMNFEWLSIQLGIMGMSSSQLTNSIIFQRVWNHQLEYHQTYIETHWSLHFEARLAVGRRLWKWKSAGCETVAGTGPLAGPGRYRQDWLR